jgi:hypothetical protein
MISSVALKRIKVKAVKMDALNYVEVELDAKHKVGGKVTTYRLKI